MTQPRRPIDRIPTERANHYPLWRLDDAIIELDVDHVFVSNNELGLVTMSISKDIDEDFGCDHVEIDLEPAAALSLVAEIVRAVQCAAAEHRQERRGAATRRPRPAERPWIQ